jgi:3-phytase
MARKPFFSLVKQAPRFGTEGLVLAGIMLAACATPATVTDGIVAVPVEARAETDPVPGAGDRADDPAIWTDPADPARSLILGTDKENGLYVYALDGRTLQYLDVGRINNVDLRGTLSVASNDEMEALSWFRIDAGARAVSHLLNTPVGKLEPYGVCLGLVEGAYLAAATYKDGTVQIWSVREAAGTLGTPAIVRTVKLESKLEGCVFDDEAKRLFIGEEAVGIWSLDLSAPESVPVRVDTIANAKGLAADVEGLSILKRAGGEGFLIASAQSADRYVVYDRKPPHAVRGVFSVAASADGRVDAVSHTDGLDVASGPFPAYPRGLLVVQDDANPRKEEKQNFKLVDWADVEAALGLTPAPQP